MSRTFSVMQYNVNGLPRLNETGRLPITLPKCAETIDEYWPDLLGMQEFGPYALSMMYGGLSDYWIYPGIPIGNDNFVNPLLWSSERFEPELPRTQWLSPTPTKMSCGWDGVERAVSYVVLHDQLNPDKKVLFVNAHLDNKGVEARINAARQIIDLTNYQRYEAVVVVGDFNSNVDGLPQNDSPIHPHALFEQAGFGNAWLAMRPNESMPITFNNQPDPYGLETPDWVLFRGSIKPVRAEIVETAKIGDTYHVSDHFPVFVEFAYTD